MSRKTSTTNEPFKKWLAALYMLIKSPAFVVFIICLGLVSFNLVATYRLRPFTSDDVFWQMILQTWHPFGKGSVTLGNSSVYVDKIPYYSFFNHFFEPSRKALFVQASIAALLGFSAFYWSCIYFINKVHTKLNYINLLPFVWLSSFGYAFAGLLLNPNWRGFQVGISFAVFALVAAVYAGDLKIKSALSKVILLLAAAFAGLQAYSDQYFLFFTLGPIILLSAVLFGARKINRRQLATIAIAILLTLIFTKLTSLLSAKAGIRISEGYQMQFIEFSKLPSNFMDSVHSVLINFNADFFGLKVTDAATIGVLLNFVLLGYIVWRAWAYVANVRKNEVEPLFSRAWPAFFAAVSGFIFITYTLSTLTIGTETRRYMLMLVLLFILLFAYSMNAARDSLLRFVLATIIITASVANLAATVAGHHDAIRPEVVSNRANYINYRLIEAVRSKGYSKGYTNYWQADINTYLSGGKISFLPSICAGETEKFHWLINDDAFNKTAGKSFFLIDDDIKAPGTCPLENILRQLGPPKESVRVDNKLILFYSYDITPRMTDYWAVSSDQ